MAKRVAQENTLNELLSYVKSTSFKYDYVLEIAKGNIPKHTLITKSGFNDVVSTGTVPEDIWNYGGNYVEPTQARLHNIVSTDAGDSSAAGNGARTVFIIGVNEGYDRVTETVSLDGINPVATKNQYLHIHLMQVTSVGSTGYNIGAITATAQTDATVTCSINANEGQSASTVFLVPNGYKAYIMRVRARMNNSTANSSAIVGLYTKPFGASLQLKSRIGLNNTGTSFVENDYTGSGPFIVQSKSWVRLRCTNVSNNNTIVEGEYDLILVQN